MNTILLSQPYEILKCILGYATKCNPSDWDHNLCETKGLLPIKSLFLISTTFNDLVCHIYPYFVDKHYYKSKEENICKYLINTLQWDTLHYLCSKNVFGESVFAKSLLSILPELNVSTTDLIIIIKMIYMFKGDDYAVNSIIAKKVILLGIEPVVCELRSFGYNAFSGCCDYRNFKPITDENKKTKYNGCISLIQNSVPGNSLSKVIKNSRVHYEEVMYMSESIDGDYFSELLCDTLKLICEYGHTDFIIDIFLNCGSEEERGIMALQIGYIFNYYNDETKLKLLDCIVNSENSIDFLDGLLKGSNNKKFEELIYTFEKEDCVEAILRNLLQISKCRNYIELILSDNDICLNLVCWVITYVTNDYDTRLWVELKCSLNADFYKRIEKVNDSEYILNLQDCLEYQDICMCRKLLKDSVVDIVIPFEMNDDDQFNGCVPDGISDDLGARYVI